MFNIYQSERKHRQFFVGLIPLETAKSPFLTSRRIAWRGHSGSGYVLRSMRRSYQAFNVLGKRIWVCKPTLPPQVKRFARQRDDLRSIVFNREGVLQVGRFYPKAA